jgi:hypothetical protein
MGMGSSRRQRNSDKQAPKTPQAAEDEQLDSAGGGQTTGPADGRGQQYDPARYAARRGYFRTFGYGIVAVYRRDFDAVGGFDLSIRGWGLEDVDFFDRCLNASAWGLRVFRAIEPVYLFFKFKLHIIRHFQNKIFFTNVNKLIFYIYFFEFLGFNFHIFIRVVTKVFLNDLVIIFFNK